MFSDADQVEGLITRVLAPGATGGRDLVSWLPVYRVIQPLKFLKGSVVAMPIQS